MTISDYLAVLRRHALTIGAVIAVAGGVGVAIALSLPAKYSSSATILVEAQQIPTELAKSTVTSSAAERLELIERRIMTRDVLLDVAERFGIFADTPGASASDIVKAMRASTRIENVAATELGSYAGAGISAFSVSFDAKIPALAANVTNEFVNLILEQNLDSRRERAQETLAFFTGEVNRLGGQLGAVEAEVARYKEENDMSLPENIAYRWTELSSLRQRLFQREDQRAVLEEQLRGLQDALAGGTLPTTAGQTLTPGEASLAELQRLLAEKRAIFSDTHPEVRNIIAQIDAMKRLIEGSEGTDPASGDGSDSSPSVREASIGRQIESIEARIATLDQQTVDDEARVAVLEAAIARAPQVETTLSTLYRDMRDLQTQYELAAAKLAEASTGERLEVNRQAERFVVIEAALLPEKPISPNRKMIAAASAGAGLILALGIVLLAEFMNRTVRSSRDLELALGVTPVAIVPNILTATDFVRQRFLRVILLLLLGAAVMGGVIAIDKYVMPLQQIGDMVRNTLGLGN